MNILIHLVLTLPILTATTERVFSTMKLVKTRLQNKMEDGFLRDCFVIYIEKEITIGILSATIIDEFDEAPHRVDFN
jgi:ABC-type tungstate transport system substrate-binding protein